MTKTIEPITHNNLEAEPRFLTAKEVSEVFFLNKLKYYRVLRMTRSGELPAMKQGKSYIYSWSALENWAIENLNKNCFEYRNTARRM